MVKQKGRRYGISILLAFSIAVALHYFLFSRINMHPTLHAIIGMIIYFALLGGITVFLERK